MCPYKVSHNLNQFRLLHLQCWRVWRHFVKTFGREGRNISNRLRDCPPERCAGDARMPPSPTSREPKGF
jgi:hypothetical protein